MLLFFASFCYVLLYFPIFSTAHMSSASLPGPSSQKLKLSCYAQQLIVVKIFRICSFFSSKIYPGDFFGFLVKIYGSGVDREIRHRFGLISSNFRPKCSTGHPNNGKNMFSNMSNFTSTTTTTIKV